MADGGTPTQPDSRSLFTPLDQVRDFHEKFGLPIGSQPALPSESERELRRRLIREDLEELGKAEEADDLIEIADALGDLVCVIYGTALSYGIDLDAVVAEIHRSNMTKTRDESVRYPAKNVRKMAGYEPPRIVHAIGMNPLG
jgi:predicted HAD superfamily Cof-like phosphohydrolase